MIDYIKKVLRTVSGGFHTDKVSERVIHAAMGISTEANEILDAVKKTLFYGKPLDKVNLKEEIGDCFWYLALLADELGVSFEEVMETNINKLKARYPEKYTDDLAINRDTDKEYEILKKDNAS